MKISDSKQTAVTTEKHKGDLFDRFDMFAVPVPSFTINRRTHQGSSIGFMWTILCGLLVTVFSTYRFVYLVTGKNPLIAQTTFYEKYNKNNTIDMAQIQGVVAFGASKFYEHKSLDDQELVQWLPQMI